MSFCPRCRELQAELTALQAERVTLRKRTDELTSALKTARCEGKRQAGTVSHGKSLRLSTKPFGCGANGGAIA